LVRTPGGTTVVNPGSVGLPSYYDDQPLPHRMESGTPFASFAVLRLHEDRLVGVEHIRVGYDFAAAAERANENGRPDWRDWILTGFALSG